MGFHKKCVWPLLFLLFVIDLPFYLSPTSSTLKDHPLKIMADVINAYTSVNSTLDAIYFQLFINSIYLWCNAWQLSINGAKSNILHLGRTNLKFIYHINNLPIQPLPFVSDLGVCVDDELSFHSHMAKITAKARGRCALFLRSFITRDPKIMIKFVTTYVRPILEYCSPVWSPITQEDILKLESVQKFFTNKIPTCTFLPYSVRLQKLSLTSLCHRRSVADLAMIHSIISGSADIPFIPFMQLIPPSVTRGHNLKITPPFLFYKHSTQNLLSRFAVCWNALADKILGSPSTSTFRRAVSIQVNDPFVK